MEWFWKFLGHIYLDDEMTSSQRSGNDWFLRHFSAAWLAKLNTSKFKIEDHHCSRTTDKQRRHNNGNKWRDIRLHKRPWPWPTLSTFDLPFWMREGPVSSVSCPPEALIYFIILVHGQRLSRYHWFVPMAFWWLYILLFKELTENF